MAKKVTLREIAKLADVSTATVSLVLNNRPEISHKTALRVREIVAQCGYDPSPATGRNRQKRRAKAVTLIMLGIPKQLLYNSIYSEFMFGLESALHAFDYTLSLRNSADGSELKGLVKTRKQDGIIVICGHEDSTNGLKHVWHLPGVEAFGKLRQNEIFDRVVVDNRAISFLAADYLAGRGHTSLAYVGRNNGIFADRGRVFVERAHELGVEAREFTEQGLVVILESEHAVNRPLLNTLLDKLLASAPRPTGLLLESDIIVTPLYQYLQQRGVRPGVDIEIVTVNNERRILSELNPQPAVIDIQAEQLGRRVAEQLLWRISHPAASRVATIVAPKLILPQAE